MFQDEVQKGHPLKCNTQSHFILTGHEVTEGLAGAGHGDADHVLAGERDGPALGLDGRRGGEALPGDLLHDVVWQAGLLEGGDGRRRVGAAHDGDLLVGAVGLDGLGVRVEQVGVRVVEVLLEGDERVLVPLGLPQVAAGLPSLAAASPA